jgi:hypothetical protein
MQRNIFCARELIITESTAAVQRSFRRRFIIEPPNEEEHLSSELSI